MIMVTGDSGMARGAVCLPRFTSEHFPLFSIVTAGVGKNIYYLVIILEIAVNVPQIVGLYLTGANVHYS